jgi:ABC-2 type transport system permease protein
MSRVFAVCRREFASYFQTPAGYVVTGLVAIISGLAFSISFLGYARMSQSPGDYGFSTVPDFEETLLSPFLVFCGMLIMFLSPLITMRLLAEEKHKGTMELLLTWPLRDRDIIFGKYAAALGMLLVMMLIIGADLAVVAAFVAIEPAVLIFGLVTVFLMGAAFISLGLFVSSITRNQITSGVITFGISLILYIAGNVSEDLPAENPAPAAWPELAQTMTGHVWRVFRKLMMELPLDAHAEEMALGILQPKDIAWYLLFCALFLFLTFRALESRNWRR